MNRIFQHTYHIPGTLTADIAVKFTAPTNCTLLHVSAVASNDSDATLRLGTSSDDDQYLLETAIGDSGVPAEFERSDFVDAQFARIEDGDVVAVTLDFDGATGTAAQDVSLVLTFAEG